MKIKSLAGRHDTYKIANMRWQISHQSQYNGRVFGEKHQIIKGKKINLPYNSLEFYTKLKIFSKTEGEVNNF